jgi:UDP-N-acetyl-D-mannosaminuronate dehydrogenase
VIKRWRKFLDIPLTPNNEDSSCRFRYVGLRLAIQFARSNVNVIGLDVFAGKKSVQWARATVERFDLVLVATNHSCVNYQELADWGALHSGHSKRNVRDTSTTWQSVESIDISRGQTGALPVRR